MISMGSPLCHECNRIALAPERAQKRRKDAMPKPDIQRILDLEKEFGSLSVSLVMRNLKTTPENARKLIEENDVKGLHA